MASQLITCHNPRCTKGPGNRPAQFLRPPRRGRPQLFCSPACGEQARWTQRKLKDHPSYPRRTPKNNSSFDWSTIPEDFVSWPFTQLVQFFMENPTIKGGVQNRIYDEWRLHNQPKEEDTQHDGFEIDFAKAPKNVKEAIQLVSRYIAAVEAERSS